MDAYQSKIRWTLILVIGMIVLFVALNARHLPPGVSKKFFWTNKSHQTEQFDIVVFGDSRVYRGFSPGVFTKGTTFTCFNFGYSSGGTSPEMLDYIESRLDRRSGGVMLIGVSPDVFTKYAQRNIQYNQEMDRTTMEVLENLYVEPFMRNFSSVKISKPLSILQGYNAKRVRELVFEDGFMPTFPSSIDSLRRVQIYANNYAKKGGIESNYVQAFLDRVQEWKNQSIRVIAYRPPTSRAMQKVEESAGFDEEDFVKRFQQAGGEWIDINEKDYVSYDASHIDGNEAIRLTKELKEKIF